MKLSTFRVPSAWLPVAMSAVALIVVAIHLWIAGATREVDESTAAHLWQLLMAGQVPVIAWFVLKWMPRAPRASVPVLAAQIIGLVVAAAPVVTLGL